MTPDRWQRINDIFLDVVASDSQQQRIAILLTACGDDADLRRDVERLLAHDNTGPALDATPFSMSTMLSNVDPTDRWIGRQLGQYIIRMLLGRGGMGNVYLAERVSDYEQQVAIKVLQHFAAGPESIKRFQAEVRFLAAMGKHPNIAALLDAGHTDDGAPYFVMEYVDGERIDHYCDRQRLNTSRRLDLFGTVCSAVQFAHQHTVIHRDLKPSNILVRTDGTAKLIDFGIAKLTQEGPTEDATRTEFRALTPDYASPEQLLGKQVTTASDVYSLGVVLYELLTGHRPHRVDSHDLIALAKSVTERDPERPSTVIDQTGEARSADGQITTISPDSVSQCRDVTPHKLRRLLNGDLDNIVLMALRKEPERRYASVEQFSADIERHLKGHPVIARTDTFTYRAGKFLKRNWAVASATALLIIALVSGSIGSLTGWMTAIRERTEATKSEARAKAINRFLTKDVLAQAAPENNPAGNNTTVREALDRAAKNIDTAFANQPEVGASVRAVIGDTYFALGMYAESEQHLRQALIIFHQHHGERNSETLAALTGLGMALEYQGKPAEAEKIYRPVLQTLREVHGPDDRATLKLTNNLAEVLHAQGNLPEAERLHVQNLETLRRVFGPDDPDTLQCMNNLAALRYGQGRAAEAEALFRQAWEARTRILGEYHPHTLSSMSNLAVALKNQGKLAEAEPLYRRALDADRHVQGPEHPETLTDMHNLASLLLAQKKFDEAESDFRETLELRRKILKPSNHPHIAYTLVGLAETLMAKDQCQNAEPLLQEALSIRIAVFPEGHPDTLRLANLLADCLINLKRFDEAEELLLANHRIVTGISGKTPKQADAIKERIVRLYELWGKPEKADEWRGEPPMDDLFSIEMAAAWQ